MDWPSHEAGRLGLPLGKDMDVASYMEGKRAAEAAERSPIPGVAFTILLITPVLFLFYPVLGLTVNALFLAVLVAAYKLPVPKELTLFIGLILCVAAFFPGYRLEARASRFGAYRLVRTVVRLLGPFAALVTLRASGEGWLFAIVLAIGIHFLMRAFDRLYFPVPAEVRKIEEARQAGLPLGRPLLKRVVYSLLWIIPVVALLNLAIRLIVGAFLDAKRGEIAAFYAQYQPVVYGLDVVVWLALVITGMLPGTSNRRRSLITHSADADA